MKLLITTQAVDNTDPILGFVIGWITEFAQHFEQVYVICLREGTYTLPSNVQVYSLGKEAGESRIKYTLRFYWFFARIFFLKRVDFVFFHMGAIYNILAVPFFLLRKIYGTKFYWWKAHGHINTVGTWALRCVDLVYTSTASGFPIVTEKRRIIGQAINSNKFVIGSHAREKEIIFVGRISPVKRLEEFIESAYELLRTDPSLRFSIIGPIFDVPYHKTLTDLCVQKGIAEKVSFLGPRTQDELVALYQKAYLFLNTGRTESMDKTVLEAALCGCIPVTGNIAFKELLASEGLYIDDATPRAYAEVIKRICNQDTEALRVRLRDAVVASHSIDTFSTRIFGI